MKTFSTISFLLLFITFSNAQVIFSSDFENWYDGKPNQWMGSATNIGAQNVQEYTEAPHSGSKSCMLTNTTENHKRFTTQGIDLEAGKTYNIQFYAKGKGELRTGLFDGGTNYTYNSYIQLQSNEWALFQQTISSTANINGQIIFSLRNTKADEHIIIDDVIVSLVGDIEIVAIYDIQHTTNPTGDSPYKDQVVSTKGVVTATHSDGYFIQDGDGAWSGLYIYDKDNKPAIGDHLLVNGNISEYYNMTEMTNVSTFEKLGTKEVPAPTIITTKQVNQEEYESVLVKVENATCTNPSAGFGMWIIDDGSGACKVHNLIYEHIPALNSIYSIVGPVFYTFDEFRIEPRSANDVIIKTSIDEFTNALPIKAYPNPTTNFITLETNDNVYITISSIIGKIMLTSQVNNSQNIDVSALENGLYFITAKTQNGQQTTTTFIKQ